MVEDMLMDERTENVQAPIGQRTVALDQSQVDPKKSGVGMICSEEHKIKPNYESLS